MQKYNVILHLIIVCVDVRSGRKYIISKKEKDILPPYLILDEDNRKNLKEHISTFVRHIVPIHTLAVMPQIISLDSPTMAASYKRANVELPENSINSVYGVLAEHIPLIDDNFHWVEFSYEIENNFSLSIFEVCQSLV